MKNKACFVILFLFLTETPLLAHLSLLLTEKEVNLIHESLPSHDPHPSSDPGKLHLSAMIYIDEDHWSLWVNDKIIRPETRDNIEGFHLEKVTHEGATFSWTPPNGTVPVTFTLIPPQTYTP